MGPCETYNDLLILKVRDIRQQLVSLLSSQSLISSQSLTLILRRIESQLVISSDDQLVLVRETSHLLVELDQFLAFSVVCKVAGVDENISVGHLEAERSQGTTSLPCFSKTSKSETSLFPRRNEKKKEEKTKNRMAPMRLTCLLSQPLLTVTLCNCSWVSEMHTTFRYSPAGGWLISPSAFFSTRFWRRDGARVSQRSFSANGSIRVFCVSIQWASQLQNGRV